MFPIKRRNARVSSSCQAEPQRPMVPFAPFSMGQALRNMSLPFPKYKNWMGMNGGGYSLLHSLKECMYFLLCCWCIKELLD